MNKLIGVLIAAAILLGVAACSVPAEAKPAETVTATVTVTPAPVIKYEYVEKVREVTPQVCIDALLGMGLIMTMEADAAGLYADLMEASYNHDVPALEAGTEKMKDLNAKVHAATTLLSPKITECRAKGK